MIRSIRQTLGDAGSLAVLGIYCIALYNAPEILRAWGM